MAERTDPRAVRNAEARDRLAAISQGGMVPPVEELVAMGLHAWWCPSTTCTFGSADKKRAASIVNDLASSARGL